MMQQEPQRRPKPMRFESTVLDAIDLTPAMRRLTLGGPQMAAWLARENPEAPAAWVKLFPPGREGRAYTIRGIHRGIGAIDIDFVLHGEPGADDGSVSSWAKYAQPGDGLQLAGPRDGGFQLLPDSGWLWLAADATALPAAQRILQSLPPALQVQALLVVHGDEEHQPLQCAARLQTEWRHELQAAQRLDAGDQVLARIFKLSGPGQVWAAGESDWVRGWRGFWLDDMGLARERVAVKGYWKIGERDHRG
ncbi:MAG: Vibriobactin utilization protein ViuB [Herbaspirillum frisingense]|uniref:Vibriobactin utilization protein ViuB n=1 Tax=Herbaspirillum frisingense TaxID=92645 RepID=A0A7V8FZI4_9BURK|nr:MAG: Vibriobactin utilization protein ViuB [Herbaspirillum frisingense]